MIRLKKIPKEPYWIDLPFGVRLRVAPPDRALCGHARSVASEMIAGLIEDIRQRKEVGAPLEGLPDIEDPHVRAGIAQLFTATAYGRAAIKEWQGVYPPEGDDIAEVTAESISDLMRLDTMAEAFMQTYLGSLDALVAEGNASGPAPNGTGDAGPATARDAASNEQRAPTDASAKTEPTAPISNTAP